MKARDWFILIFTFFVGALCGVYLYVTSFKPVYENDGTAEKLEVGELSIIGVQYGGYVREGFVYPSFRVQEDGSYSYIGSDDSVEKVTGELPNNLFNNLSSDIVKADLDKLSNGNGADRCQTYEDGPIQYEYNIVFEEKEYTLDTCLTNFTNDTPLGKTLLEVWDYMASPDEFKISIKNSPDTSEGATETRKKSTWTLNSYFENGFKEAGFQDD